MNKSRAVDGQAPPGDSSIELQTWAPSCTSKASLPQMPAYNIYNIYHHWSWIEIWCLSSSLKVEAMIGVHGLTTVAEDSTGWLQTYFFIVCLLPPVLNADFASMHHVASPSYPWLHCTRWLIGVPSKGCFFSPKRARYYVFHLFPMKSSSCIHIISIYIYPLQIAFNVKNVHFEWQS